MRGDCGGWPFIINKPVSYKLHDLSTLYSKGKDFGCEIQADFSNEITFDAKSRYYWMAYIKFECMFPKKYLKHDRVSVG